MIQYGEIILMRGVVQKKIFTVHKYEDTQALLDQTDAAIWLNNSICFFVPNN